jgi:hypothetical protein
VAIAFLAWGGTLTDYFLSAVLIGVGGALIDIWVYSKISETVGVIDKGKAISIVSWSYDVATITGAQIPATMATLLGISPFTAAFTFPLLAMAIYVSRLKFRT